MNYELAKELKEAGFPQKMSRVQTKPFTKVQIKKMEEDLNRGNAIIIPCDESYIPTLSELIEACGDNLLGIEHILDGGLDGKEKLWWASSKNHGMAGLTPEEAVARLWLALNRK